MSNIDPRWGKWATPPKPYAKEDFDEEYTTEVLVIGAGICGLSCAYSAAEMGCEVTVIEKLPMYHGFAFNVGVVNSKFMRSKGIVNDPDEVAREWIKRCGNRCDERLVRKFVDKSEEAMDWALDLAMRPEYGVRPSLQGAVYKGESYYEIYGTHIFYDGPIARQGKFGGLNDIMEPMYQESLKLGTKYFYNTTMEQLIKENGRVTGAAARTKDGKLIAVRASKGVLVSTGGIGGNDEMCEDLCPIANKVAAKVNVPKGIDLGEGHKAALWAGAAFEDAPFPTMMHPQAIRHPNYCFLFVTPKGKRFMNEDNYLQGRSFGVIKAGYKWCWAIFDGDWAEKIPKTLDYGGGIYWGESFDLFTGTPFDEKAVGDKIQWSLDNGFAVKADTPRELAEKMGIDADEFVKTFEQYNEYCRKGHDDEFGKRKELLIPLDKPPYYARKFGPALLSVCGGVKVDENFRALDENNEVVEGLYVLGNTMAGRYGVDYPMLLPGNSVGSGLTYGYLLGRDFGKMK
ncbi:MAG: FAD-dependent oxidoreductase [Firmicutes bacterium]|nr:FAD-dependent oxidoreductase [Bacillota bacterium]